MKTSSSMYEIMYYDVKTRNSLVKIFRPTGRVFVVMKTKIERMTRMDRPTQQGKQTRKILSTVAINLIQ